MTTEKHRLPECRWFVFCHALNERENGIDLMGVTNRFVFLEFPAVLPPLTLAAALAGDRGEYRLSCAVFDRKLGQTDQEFDFGVANIEDPLIDVYLHVKLRRSTFDAPGDFDFILFSNGSEWARQTMKIVRASSTP